MQIQLIEGQFQREDALDLITQMIHVKIKFHEKKIDKDQSEEDIRARETKIKKLQKELFELRQQMKPESKQVKMNAVINLD
jgi:ribosomal protein L29